MVDQSKEITEALESLQHLVKRFATVNMADRQLFLWCLSSSFTKAFEFVELTCQYDDGSSYFLTASLRSITEDIILLSFLARKPHDERELVVGHLMELEVAEDTRRQKAFFQTFRPFQPVLSGKNHQEKRLKEELKDFWRKNGWPKFNKKTPPPVPPTREIAGKLDKGFLEAVYNFVYRLSSNSVHFGPRALLRTGWGDLESTATFSTKNMEPYYRATAQIYGSYLLCLYFEIFEDFLKPTEREKESVERLRNHLLRIFRWPEMVTYEEMNLDVPDSESQRRWPNPLIYALYAVVMEKGFLAGAQEVLTIHERGGTTTVGEASET